MIPYSAVDALTSMRRIIGAQPPPLDPPDRYGIWRRFVALARRPAPIVSAGATQAGKAYREGAYGVDAPSGS